MWHLCGRSKVKLIAYYPPTLWPNSLHRYLLFDDLAKASQIDRIGVMDMSGHFLYNPNTKIDAPHRTPDREPRLHRELVELAKALRSNNGGAVDMSGHDSANDDSSAKQPW